MSLREISSNQFNRLITEGKTFVLHFWAEWNNYDFEQKQTIEMLRYSYPYIDFYEMNIDAESNYEICKKHKVAGPPTVVFYKNGKLQNRVVGVLSGRQIEEELHCAKFT